MSARPLLRRLVGRAAARYRPAGRFAYFFARAKLTGDPFFATLLSRGLIPGHADVLDLGCGQGLLAAWLDAARACFLDGDWPAGWPPPPDPATFRGIDSAERDVGRARRALGDSARIESGDIRIADFPSCDVVVLLDVLHYLEPDAQERVLARVHAALRPAGALLLRVGDAGAGFGFLASRWVDAVVQRLRGRGRAPLHCRAVPEWRAVLERAGFASCALPMSAGTPFANVLLVAHPR